MFCDSPGLHIEDLNLPFSCELFEIRLWNEVLLLSDLFHAETPTLASLRWCAPGLNRFTWGPEHRLSVGLRQPRSILVIVCCFTKVEGLDIFGFCDGHPDLRIGEVPYTQGGILHPRD